MCSSSCAWSPCAPQPQGTGSPSCFRSPSAPPAPSFQLRPAFPATSVCSLLSRAHLRTWGSPGDPGSSPCLKGYLILTLNPDCQGPRFKGLGRGLPIILPITGTAQACGAQGVRMGQVCLVMGPEMGDRTRLLEQEERWSRALQLSACPHAHLRTTGTVK